MTVSPFNWVAREEEAQRQKRMAETGLVEPIPLGGQQQAGNDLSQEALAQRRQAVMDEVLTPPPPSTVPMPDEIASKLPKLAPGYVWRPERKEYNDSEGNFSNEAIEWNVARGDYSNPENLPLRQQDIDQAFYLEKQNKAAIKLEGGLSATSWTLSNSPGHIDVARAFGASEELIKYIASPEYAHQKNLFGQYGKGTPNPPEGSTPEQAYQAAQNNLKMAGALNQDGTVNVDLALKKGMDKDLQNYGFSKSEIDKAQSFLKDNVKVNIQGKDQWIPKTTWEGLDADQRAEVAKTGKYTVSEETPVTQGIETGILRAGEDRPATFTELIASGKIPKDSIYISTDPDGSVHYASPDKVKVVGRYELMSLEDYKNLPPEWKAVVDKDGLSALKKRQEAGDLPLPDVLGNEWFYNGQKNIGKAESQPGGWAYRGQVISDNERQRLVDEYNKRKMELVREGDTIGLAKLQNPDDEMASVRPSAGQRIISNADRDRLIDEYNKARMKLVREGNTIDLAKLENPEQVTTRAKRAIDMIEDTERLLGTVNLNVEKRVENWAKENKTTEASDLIPEGSPLKRFVPDFPFRTGAIAGGVMTGLELVLVNPSLFMAKSVVKPESIPESVWGMLRSIYDSGYTGYAYFVNGEKVPGWKLGESVAILGTTAKSGLAAGKQVLVWAHPRGVPEGLISKEASTGRIRLGDADPVNLTRSFTEVMRESAKPGKDTGTVKVKGADFELRFLRTSFQQDIGSAYWSGTNAGLESFKGMLKSGELKAGKEGLYMSSYAAPNFVRGGEGDPGYLLILTDPAKLRDVPAKELAKISESDAFIRDADPGIYGQFKTYRGALETEAIAAPGTTFEVPKTNSDFTTRALAGDYADFFTYDSGKLVPIKIAIDKSITGTGNVHTPTPVELYALKLRALENALQNFTEAVRHPTRTVNDIISRRSGPPGVRDVEIVTDGVTTMELAKAFDAEVTGKPRGKSLGRELTDAQKARAYREYKSRAEAILRDYETEVRKYNASQEMRDKFEQLYRYAVGQTFERFVKAQERISQTVREVSRIPTESRPGSESRTITETGTKRETERTIRKRGARTIEETPARENVTVREGVGREATGRAETRTVETPSTRRPPPRKIREPVKLPPPNTPQIGKGASDKEARAIIAASEGAVTWRQGELHGKDVWYVLKYPFQNKDDFLSVLGHQPAGATKVAGPGSAYKTTQRLYGKPPSKDVMIDVGAFDANLSKEGKMQIGISFRPDPLGKTKGDFSISKSVGRLEKGKAFPLQRGIRRL